MRPERTGRAPRAIAAWACAIAALGTLAGCAGVSVSSITPRQYVLQQRSDMLSAGTLSVPTTDTLRALGVDSAACELDPRPCRDAIVNTSIVGDEERLSALSELWLQRALRLAHLGPDQVDPEVVRSAYLEVVRYAYAYLFFTTRRPGARAFEDRQAQILDFYNFSVLAVVTRTFPRYRGRPPVSPATLSDGGWVIHLAAEDGQPPGQRRLPDELVPAASLRFDGLRNVYRRDGFGAEMVAVLARDAPDGPSGRPFTPMDVVSMTAVMSFRGATLEEVLRTNEVDLVSYDPFRYEKIRLQGAEVPLAANFSAAYGLWLARSGFAGQALRGVFGRAGGAAAPHVFLMQPFDPNRRVVITLHGLASSPEAWVNLTNELLGDDILRQRFQVWQLQYPTNAPIMFNLRNIRDAIDRTFQALDPSGAAPASREVVLVGHSMGGVLARLLVSSSGEAIKSEFVAEQGLEGKALAKATPEVAPYLVFEPMPRVTRAVFISAPHRGTEFANRRIAHWVANLVLLPYELVAAVAELNQNLARFTPDRPGGPGLRVPNSIENLSDRNLVLRLTDTMPISPRVQYHSMMGNVTPALPLAESTDGVVPFRSAHLRGAVSEKVIQSGHSAQETPEASLELRRILRAH